MPLVCHTHTNMIIGVTRNFFTGQILERIARCQSAVVFKLSARLRTMVPEIFRDPFTRVVYPSRAANYGRGFFQLSMPVDP